MASRRKKIPKISDPKPRNPEARLLACPSLRLRVAEKRPAIKSERARIRRELKTGRMPEGGADRRSVALSGMWSPAGSATGIAFS